MSRNALVISMSHVQETSGKILESNLRKDRPAQN